MNDELKKTEDIIYDTIGYKTKLFRFPSGDYNEKALKYVRNRDINVFNGMLIQLIGKQAGAEVEYNRVMKNIKEGSIVIIS